MEAKLVSEQKIPVLINLVYHVLSMETNDYMWCHFHLIDYSSTNKFIFALAASKHAAKKERCTQISNHIQLNNTLNVINMRYGEVWSNKKRTCRAL